jgi:hypothetical protein
MASVGCDAKAALLCKKVFTLDSELADFVSRRLIAQGDLEGAIGLLVCVEAPSFTSASACCSSAPDDTLARAMSCRRNWALTRTTTALAALGQFYIVLSRVMSAEA